MMLERLASSAALMILTAEEMSGCGVPSSTSGPR